MSKKLMRAYRIVEIGKPPQWQEIEVPAPGYGEVLLRMGGAGLCRSDLEMIDHGRELLPFKGPFTLGHENAGWVEAVGPGVEGLEIGAAVISSCIHSCGHCEACLAGHDNYCESVSSRGCAEDGGLAEYMIAEQRELVLLGDLDPQIAAPLADAGLTSYRAVAAARHKIPGDAVAVVIGVGGLGSFAVQFLRELTGARIVAVDVDKARLEMMRELGADDTVLSGDSTGDKIDALTGHKGVHAVFDFVGNNATLALAARITRRQGIIVLCGLGGGALSFGWATVKPGVDVRISNGGSLSDLRAVIDLARRGRLTIETDQFDFARVEDAYQALRTGALRGRAVITFNKR